MIMDCRERLNWPSWDTEVEYLYNHILEYGGSHPEPGLGRTDRRFTSQA